jgi:hypothetical protein
MATRDDRVYRVEEIGNNQLLTSFDTNSFSQPGGGGGGGGAAASVGTTGGGAGVLAFDPYTSPYIKSRRVFFTINTYTNLSKKGVLAKAFLNGVEVEDQSISKGRITFSLDEQRLLNPSTLTLVSGDLKPQKYFIIQARKDVENEVSIIEYDIIGDTTPSPLLGTPSPTGEGLAGGTQDLTGGQFDGSGGNTIGGGASGFGGGGGMREVNPNDFRGPGFGVAGTSRNDREAAQQ